jgi:plastocyanin
VAALVLAVGLVIASAGCSSSSPAAKPTGPTITTANLSFSPDTLTVAPGATVTVVNNDQILHNVASLSGKFKTPTLQPGASSTFRAPTTPGRYPYTCTIHPFMRATLVVR